MSRKHASARRRPHAESLEPRLCLSSLPGGTSPTPPDAATQARLSAAYGQLPLSFEANQGQTDSHVNFLARGAGYTVFLTPAKAVLEMTRGDSGNVVAMRVIGANPTTRPVGLDKQAGVSNYLIGNDPSKWHTGIANFGEASYKGVYRGIDLVYHGDQRQLEYDFVVKPGASPAAIRLAFDGTQGKTLDAQGNLVLHTSGGDLVEHAPVAYQMVHGERHSVVSRFGVGRDGQVGFQVGRYDHGLPLVIDPVLSLSYSTFLGGTNNDEALAVAVDSSGAAYLTGWTASVNFPTSGAAYQSSIHSSIDAFVVKLAPNLSGSASLVYSTFLGGNGIDHGLGIAADGAGAAYVTGATSSSDFPTMNAFQSSGGGGYSGFLAKLSPSGSKLLYSSYFGGNLIDSFGMPGIAVDGADNAYVTGTTMSTSFPTTVGAYRPTGSGAFLAKFNPSSPSAAGSLVYSTLLGADHGYAVAVDSSGDAFVAGRTITGSSSFVTTAGAYQAVGGGNDDAFVSKVNPAGSGLVYSTYLGGANADEADAIALDSAGNAYLSGFTYSTNFPTRNAFQPNIPNTNRHVFMSELSADGRTLLYSSFLGGSGSENARPGGIAVDAFGKIYVTGDTSSADFPTKYPLQTFGVAQFQPFVTKIDPTLAGSGSLVYSTILGNSDTGYGRAIAAYTDSSGRSYAYVTGNTYAYAFPTTGTAYQPKPANKNKNSGTEDAFFSKLAFN